MTLGYREELILPAVFKTRRDSEGKAMSAKVPEYFKGPQIPWQTVIKRKNFQRWERQTAFLSCLILFISCATVTETFAKSLHYISAVSVPEFTHHIENGKYSA